MKDATQDMAQDVAQGLAEDLSGAAKDRGVEVLILSIAFFQRRWTGLWLR